MFWPSSDLYNGNPYTGKDCITIEIDPGWFGQTLGGIHNNGRTITCIVLANYSQYFQFSCTHDDVIKWRHFRHYWSVVRGLHRSPVIFPSQRPVTRPLWGIFAWINGGANNQDVGDLRSHCAHYNVIVMNTSDEIFITINKWFYLKVHTFMLCIGFFNDKKWHFIILFVKIQNDHHACLYQALYFRFLYTKFGPFLFLSLGVQQSRVYHRVDVMVWFVRVDDISHLSQVYNSILSCAQ